MLKWVWAWNACFPFLHKQKNHHECGKAARSAWTSPHHQIERFRAPCPLRAPPRENHPSFPLFWAQYFFCSGKITQKNQSDKCAWMGLVLLLSLFANNTFLTMVCFSEDSWGNPREKGTNALSRNKRHPHGERTRNLLWTTTFLHLRKITAGKIKTLNTPAAHSKMTDNIFGLKHCFSGPFYHFFKKHRSRAYLDVRWACAPFGGREYWDVGCGSEGVATREIPERFPSRGHSI